ncbi:hypothetical protein [Actinomadura sp.]|uniref:hypothetical protein n=1 Tax=Actinomadura sp. TaxID=1989 RepID=UPI0037CC3BA9
MEFIFNPPSRWDVTLKSGSILVIRADVFSEVADDFVFYTAVRASVEEREGHEVVSDFFSDPEEVFIVTARLPRTEVEGVEGGPV